MKQTYETPKLIVHGTVEEMTKAFAPSYAYDTAQFGGQVVTASGSQDGVFVPQ